MLLASLGIREIFLMAHPKVNICPHGHNKEITGVYLLKRKTLKGTPTIERVCKECSKIKAKKRYKMLKEPHDGKQTFRSGNTTTKRLS